MLQAILFDFDGTLVDSEFFHFQIWHQLLAEFGIDFQESDYCSSMLGRCSQDSAAWAQQNWQLPHTWQTLLQQRNQRLLRALRHQTPPLMPHALPLLKYLKARGLRLAVVSGSTKSNVKQVLTRHGIETFFDTLCTGDRVERNKPHPDSYHLAMTELNLQPHQCLAVEDSPTGITAARAAGLRCLGVRNSHSATDEFKMAHYTCDDLMTAHSWIAGILA